LVAVLAEQIFGKCVHFTLRGRQGQILQTLSGESKNSIAPNHIEEDPLTLEAVASHFALPWSACVRLLSVKNPEARAFYETEALRLGWSVRQLDRQIGNQFYERVALSQNKAAMLEKAGTPEPSDLVTPEEAIKDPFVLEFLDLKDEYCESDLEDALIQRLAEFLLELGDDFAFLGRQRRLRIDDNWFRIDLSSSSTAACEPSSSWISRLVDSVIGTLGKCISI
jgi:predicted nuclease of restriction endonuclease-like (RecB) superfamily